MEATPLGLWIRVGQRLDVRQELTDEIVRNNLLPFILMIPLVAVLIGILVRRGLSPLVRVSRQITERNPDNLEALQPGALPEEVEGVVQATNRLLANLAAAFERERRFRADAAHELRTPLAAVGDQRQPPAAGAGGAGQLSRKIRVGSKAGLTGGLRAQRRRP